MNTVKNGKWNQYDQVYIMQNELHIKHGFMFYFKEEMCINMYQL